LTDSLAVLPALGSAFLCGSPFEKQDEINIRACGAKGDGRTKDTLAIQQAIDDCARGGGGTVRFPAGRFLSGTLHLRSNILLYLSHGAELVASPDAGDFDPYEKLSFKNEADKETSFFHHALIWAEDAENVAITGTGTIDGNRKKRGGPKPVALKSCRHVTIQGIQIRNAPNYGISLLGSDYVNIDGVTILNGYADGIDPDCCRHVRIANCHIECWDDAIVPKTSFSLGERRSTENVTVTNCVLATSCNAFKLGTESGGDFRNIAVSNCAFFARPNAEPPISGISLLTVDGGSIDGVAIDNIAMTGVRCPVFFRLGNRGRDMPMPVPGSLKNVAISNIVASGAKWPCAIVGIPGHPVEGITLSNCRIHCLGGGNKRLDAIPEYIAKYPSAEMFGNLPSFGLYARHVRDLELARVHFQKARSDPRLAIACEDVSGFKNDSPND
jgi:polygalacturonase